MSRTLLKSLFAVSDRGWQAGARGAPGTDFVRARPAVEVLVTCMLVGVIVSPIVDRLHLPFATVGFSAVVSLMPGFSTSFLIIVAMTFRADPAAHAVRAIPTGAQRRVSGPDL